MKTAEEMATVSGSVQVTLLILREKKGKKEKKSVKKVFPYFKIICRSPGCDL